MDNYDEQRKRLVEAERHPEVKKLKRRAFKFMAFCGLSGGVVFLGLWLIYHLGFDYYLLGLFVAGVGLIGSLVFSALVKKTFAKKEALINRILAFEFETADAKQTEKAALQGIDFFADNQETQKEDSTDIIGEQEEYVKKLVCLHKRQTRASNVLMIFLLVGVLVSFFVPFCELLGIEKISTFDLVKDWIQNRKESLFYVVEKKYSYADIAMVECIIMSVSMLFAAIWTLIATNTNNKEMMIRQSKGKIRESLSKEEIKKVKMVGLQFGAGGLFGCVVVFILWLAIWSMPFLFWLTYKDVVNIEWIGVGTVFAVCFVFMFLMFRETLSMKTERKDAKVLAAIFLAEKKRNKRK